MTRQDAMTVIILCAFLIALVTDVVHEGILSTVVRLAIAGAVVWLLWRLPSRKDHTS